MAEELIYAVYIMTNVTRGVLYVGITSDLASRALQHREGSFPGFTQKWACKRLAWFELHGDVTQAIAREKLIKRWRRAWKFRLIEGRNPDWEDLWPALMGQAPYPWEEAMGVDKDPSAESASVWYRGDRPKG